VRGHHGLRTFVKADFWWLFLDKSLSVSVFHENYCLGGPNTSSLFQVAIDNRSSLVEVPLDISTYLSSNRLFVETPKFDDVLQELPNRLDLIHLVLLALAALRTPCSNCTQMIHPDSELIHLLSLSCRYPLLDLSSFCIYLLKSSRLSRSS